MTAGSTSLDRAREPQDERRADGAALIERHEALTPPVGFGPIVPDVADDADDPPRAQELDRPADRILSRKVVPRRGLVDDRDGFAALPVRRRQRTGP